MKKLIIFFSFVVFFISVNCINQDRNEKVNVTEIKVSNKDKSFIPKIDEFKDVNTLQEKLSRNGIGVLRKWHKDSFGWISYTDYYSFGIVNSNSGMKNNLSYYIESDSKEYVKLLKIVLNINNKNDKKKPLDIFKDVIKKTYNSLNLKIPEGLMESINDEMVFEDKEELYYTKLEFEETKIETWKLIIESR